MTRKFTWQDIPTLPRYHNRQVFLDTSLALTYAPGVLSSVLQSLLTRGMCVSVHHAGIIGQVCHSAHKTSARLAFVAPQSALADPGMMDLLTHLSQQAGEMGAFRVLVEVEEGTPLVDHLRRAGFNSYAQQRVWRFPARGWGDSHQEAWKPVSARNLGDIHTLYQKLVPGEVKRVEPPPTAADLRGLVFHHEGKLHGYAAAQFGPKGVLLDVLLDPSQDEHQAHLTAIRSNLPIHRSQAVYVRVRSYQQKLGTALGGLTTSPTSTQIVMVKRLAIHHQVRQTFKLPVLEQQPEASTPIISSESGIVHN